MGYFLTFVHELGHAVVLVHHGRRVKSAGFMIYFGSPAFFVESSDGLMLDRGKRIVQSSAGPFAELVIGRRLDLPPWAFPDWSLAPVLYKFAVLNYFVIFLNLVPLLELDGYYILADLIQVPDLRPRSLQFIRYDLWHKLRGREHFTKQEVGLGLLRDHRHRLHGLLPLLVGLLLGDDLRRADPGVVGRGLIGRRLLVVLALFIAGSAVPRA